MKKLTIIILVCVSHNFFSQATAFDLIMCSSNDGVSWTNNALFQDSSGVPSIAQHSTGIVFCAFQWFCAPATMTNTLWDKIAIKKSMDGGLTWGSPTLAVFTGSPSGYKRPFDPTIVIADNGQIRMYFSSSKTGSLTLLDSTVHCYSAISPDGINYTWESGVRVLVKDSINIDPAVLKIGSVWHYTCPRGAPQHGAHHFISNDGLAFTRTTSIASDMNHNFTGNIMSNIPGGGTDFRFYGTASPQTGAIWYKSTNDGIGWNPAFSNCSGPVTSAGIQADPAVIKLGTNNYLMVYVSKLSNVMLLNRYEKENEIFKVYPNPSNNQIEIKLSNDNFITGIKIMDIDLREVYSSTENLSNYNFDLQKGIYFLEVKTSNGAQTKKLIIQ